MSAVMSPHVSNGAASSHQPQRNGDASGSTPIDYCAYRQQAAADLEAARDAVDDALRDHDVNAETAENVKTGTRSGSGTGNGTGTGSVTADGAGAAKARNHRNASALNQLKIAISALDKQSRLHDAKSQDFLACLERSDPAVQKKVRTILQVAAAKSVEAQRSQISGTPTCASRAGEANADLGESSQTSAWKPLSTSALFLLLTDMSKDISGSYLKVFEKAADTYLKMIEKFNVAAATASQSMKPMPSTDDKKEPKTAINVVRLERAMAGVIESYMDTKGAKRPFSDVALKSMTLKPEFDLYSGATRAKAEEWLKNFGLQDGKAGQLASQIVQRGDRWCVTMDMAPMLRFYENIPGRGFHTPYSLIADEVWVAPESQVYGNGTVGSYIDEMTADIYVPTNVSHGIVPALNAAMLQAWQSSSATDKETANGTVQLLTDKTRNAAALIANLNRLIGSSFETLMNADKSFLSF